VIEVGSYSEYASPFGLLDVVGNAWEWVADAYDAEEYSTEDTVDPTGPDCDEDCAFRVLRGGAYNTTEDTLYTAARSFGRPDVVDNNIGFRCAYDR
jgi:formylglycine-generating enzyme required for sulfatase activity